MNNNKFLIVNPGSTAVKYTIFTKEGDIAEKYKFSFSEIDQKRNLEFLKSLKNVEKIGIRVVHGGLSKGPVFIDNEVLEQIKKFEIFAPIHNKIALSEIKKLKKIFKITKIYAVFDTDFHHTIPEENYTIPINQEIAKKYNIRKYGFHGIAVESDISQVKQYFKKKIKKKLPNKIIVCHLGGGSSVTAVKNGKSFSNSMGLTPISGLMMKTRVGDIDSDADKILAKQMGKAINYISDMFSNQSGFLGITGSVDTLDIFEKAQKEMKTKIGKYEKEKLAFEIYLNSIIKKIFAYAGIMNGVELLIFSGGIGENNIFLQKQVVKKLKLLGITKKNILIVSVDEEKEILRKIIKC